MLTAAGGIGAVEGNLVDDFDEFFRFPFLKDAYLSVFNGDF